MTEGITERQFIEDLEPQLRKLGWWGKKALERPSGAGQLVQLGSRHRLETIYRTNMAFAYNAGCYKRMKENVADRPCWQYVAVIDSRTCYSHRKLHGKVFRYDDSFWDTFYPPNGWNCRCRVRALTDQQVADKGLTVEKGEQHLEAFRQKVAVDKDTDEVIKTDAARYRGKDAAGKLFVVVPDAGFGYNPGKGWVRWDNIDAPGSRVVAAGQKTFRDYGLSVVTVGSADQMPPLLKASDSIEDAHKKLADEIMGDADCPVVETPVDPVVIRREWLWHIVEDRDARRERYAKSFLRTFEDPNEVWLTRYEDGRFRRVFIKRFEDENGERFFVSIARENADGSLAWTGFLANEKYVKNRRVGTLLYFKK